MKSSALIHDEDQEPFVTPRTVYVLHMDYHDFTEAREFGELRPVLMGRQNIDRLSKLREKIKEVLETAGADDYLLLSGHPVIVALGLSVWNDRGFAWNNRLLYYDSFERGYKEYKEDD